MFFQVVYGHGDLTQQIVTRVAVLRSVRYSQIISHAWVVDWDISTRDKGVGSEYVIYAEKFHIHRRG